MLVLSRKPGESVVIDDVLFTFVRASATHATATLQKLSGGRITEVELPIDQYVDACYDTRIIFIASRIIFIASRDHGSRGRFGFEYPDGISIHRKEVSSSF